MTADPFLRISVLGSTHNADLVVPSDQPATTLLPQFLGLLGEPHGPQGTYTLTTALGEPIDLHRPMGEVGLVDGAVLRLSQETETPPVPVVSDLVDATAEHEASGLWANASRGWVLSVCSALMTVVALVFLLLLRGPDALDVGIGATGLYVVSMLCRILRKDLAWAYFIAGGVVGIWWAWLQLMTGTSPLTVLLILLVAQLISLLVHTRQRFAYAIGLAVLAVSTGAWWLIHFLVVDPVRAGAITATLALLLLGLAPRLALSIAGVFKADDAVGHGASMALSEVVSRLNRAHQVLSVAVVLLAGLWTLGILPVAGTAIGNVWALAMTASLVVAWTLRGRHFPLTTERTAIYVAALIATSAVAWSQRTTPWAPIAAAALALFLAVMLFVRTSDLAAAQLRRIATWVETAAVILTVPVLVGMFDLYTQLLGSFQ
ncbi:EsaB/YukD family protein [Arachnia propionica]|uniref:EsaB/YukD family protein n=1 Tax=Arachnia propionica TaxID=1750 RepID=UPI0030CAF87C